ncbi:hypothetical protein [Macrococcus brunensis]|uniref:hypothetical protein n=1 Tax=Macrococcus brunensis TaxID=198483 RepID=UPI001EF03342|nr:hypothetical protein [Macrococcus brunensis]ULG71168.1 hypothetical protein MGG12_07390 [Macrococcus brunensis]
MTFIFTKTAEQIEKEKERILNICQSRGVKAARDEVTEMINFENRARFASGSQQNARTTNPIYMELGAIIDNYEAALNDKEEMFKQFVLHHKEFKQWLANKEK